MGIFDTIAKFIPPLATSKAIVEQAPKVISGQSSFESAAKAVNAASGQAILTTGAAAVGLVGVAKSPTITGKVISGAGGLIGSGYFSKANPQQTISSAGKITGNTVSGLYNVGGNVQKFSESPSFESGANIFRENPFIAGAIVTGAAIVGGKAASNVISGFSSYLNTQATKENTQAIIAGNQPILNSLPQQEAVTSPISKTLAGTAPQVSPTGPQTASYELIPENQPQKKKSITPYKPRKSKNINRSPITIRNYNIMAVKSHG